MLCLLDAAEIVHILRGGQHSPLLPPSYVQKRHRAQEVLRTIAKFVREMTSNSVEYLHPVVSVCELGPWLGAKCSLHFCTAEFHFLIPIRLQRVNDGRQKLVSGFGV